LTFKRGAGRFGLGIVNKRVATWVVSLLYLSVALYFGVVHHHEDQCGLNEPDHCGACQWAMAVTSDVPVAVALVVVALAFTDAPPEVSDFRLQVDFAAATASRAPPVSLA
jgi:flagellar biosynthesis protein FlhB